MIHRREFIGATAAACALGVGFCSADQRSDWSFETIQTIPRSPWHYAPVVTGVALQPAGNQLAVVGDDHFISIYDLPTGSLLTSLDKHRDWIRAARFSPDGRLLATSGNDRQILLWDAQSWRLPIYFPKQPQAIADMAFSPDGSQLATVGFDARLRLFDIGARRLVREYEMPCPDMHAVTFSNNGSRIIAGGRSGVIRAVDAADGNVAWDIAAHAKRVRSVAVNSSDLVLSCGEDQVVRVFPAVQGTAGAVLEKRMAAKQFAAVWIDEQTFATAGADNLISVWDLSTKTVVNTLAGHTGTISCLTCCNGHLVSGSFDTQVRIWRRHVHASRETPTLQQASGWSQQLK